MPSPTGGSGQPPAAVAEDTVCDGVLAARALAGDPLACRGLMERHLAPVLRYAARLLADSAEAEDVAQETFLRLWRSLDRWSGDGSGLAAWLFRVAHNLCIDRIRRRRTVPLDAVAEPMDERPDAAAALIRRERDAAVAAAIDALPERQRAALLLCHHEGLSNAEAGAILGVGVEAVESLLARARRSLRQRLVVEAPAEGSG